MLYLSDPIYIEKNFENSGVGTYLSYSVYLRPLGVNPITLKSESYKQIYRGHIYVTGETQRIYLNDIIAPHLYNHSYIQPQISIDTDGECIGMVKSLIDYPVSNVMVRVTYDGGTIPVDEINVLQYYADNQKHNFPSPNIETDDNPMIINALSLRTNVYPRVPRITKPTTKFWVGTKFFITRGLWVDETERNLEWIDMAPNASITTITQKPLSDDNCRSQFAWNISDYDYMHLSKIKGNEFGITNTFSSIKMKVGEFDSCNSDFYLIWMDRTGAYQCQPFNKRAVRKEDITTTNIINAVDETRPIQKSVKNTWTLNSDWLSFEEYRAYESIFTSPYLYLYDYKNDEGYWVNCTNKSWEERNSSNTKKPFNLTINLESNQAQNIIY